VLSGLLTPDIRKIACQNVSLQRGIRKKLLMAPSQVEGWGCFIDGPAAKDDLIWEYTGEAISKAEADRRGMVYDAQKQSYLFKLDSGELFVAIGQFYHHPKLMFSFQRPKLTLAEWETRYDLRITRAKIQTVILASNLYTLNIALGYTHRGTLQIKRSYSSTTTTKATLNSSNTRSTDCRLWYTRRKISNSLYHYIL